MDAIGVELVPIVADRGFAEPPLHCHRICSDEHNITNTIPIHQFVSLLLMVGVVKKVGVIAISSLA